MKIRLPISKDYHYNVFQDNNSKTYNNDHEIIEIDLQSHPYEYTVYQKTNTFVIDNKHFVECAVSKETKDKYNFIILAVHKNKISSYYSYLFIKSIDGTLIARQEFVTTHQKIVNFFGKLQIAKSLFFDLGLQKDEIY